MKNATSLKLLHLYEFFLGASLKQASSYLSAAVLAGYLATKQQAGGDGIILNLVNAPAMAKEQNLQVRINVTI